MSRPPGAHSGGKTIPCRAGATGDTSGRTMMAEVRAALAGDASLTGFYSDMTLSEWRTFVACYLGWAFDAVAFMIFPIVLVTIMNLWGVERGPAGLAVTLTLLTSAVGGWLAGYLSDLIGRVRTLQITVIWFSAFTLLSAF